MLKDTDDRPDSSEKMRKTRPGGRMQTFQAKVECTTTITGRDREDAYDALVTWLEGNEKDWKIISFEPIGDVW